MKTLCKKRFRYFKKNQYYFKDENAIYYNHKNQRYTWIFKTDKKLYKYFYTEKELRTLKLKQLNNE